MWQATQPNTTTYPNKSFEEFCIPQRGVTDGTSISYQSPAPIVDGQGNEYTDSHNCRGTLFSS